jgi:hypothetical protein
VLAHRGRRLTQEDHAEELDTEMRTPTLIKARGGVGAAVWLCFLTLGAGGAWAVATATNPPRLHRPPLPTFGTVPPRSTTQVSAVFSFFDRQRRVYFQCSLDGAPFKDCSSRVRYGPLSGAGRVRCKGQSKRTKGRHVKWCPRRTPSRQRALSLGTHVFRVRAVKSKMVGTPASYTWTILDSGTSSSSTPSSGAAGGSAGLSSTGGGSAPVAQQERFGVTGNPEGPLYPGGAPRRIWLELTNPNAMTIYVTGVAVSATSEDPACSVEENVLITQSDASPLTPVVVPSGGSVTLPAQGITAPAIQLIDLQSVNQDACKGATFVLRYSGSAHA